MKNQTTYRILVIDSNESFLRSFNYALQQFSITMTNYLMDWKILNSFKKLGIHESKNWSHIFLDSSFVNEISMNFMKEVLKVSPFCNLILIVSNTAGHYIKETIKTIDSIELPLNLDFILGDNLSDAMKVDHCFKYITNK